MTPKRKAAAMLAAVLLALAALTGCGLLDGVNETIGYVNDATGYINEATAFVSGAASLAEQAVMDEKAREQLRAKLAEMKASIAEFNRIEPPEFAKSIHRQLVEHNEALRIKLDAYSEQIRSGNWSWSGSGIAEAVAPITALLDKIKELRPAP
ncbi:DUF6376 family protein [Paenibacillus sp. GYB003]|jgi:hypothetical protein|uniref:DUF6376 family protein n=1 Tax=Paenibacillus sp. GYB003 TaxID=2994392 RepID=UPI002F9667AF